MIRKQYTSIDGEGREVMLQCHPDLNKAIIVEKADGSVAIYPVDPIHRFPSETEEQQTTRILAKITNVFSTEIIDFWQPILRDHTFRNAWRKTPGTVTHDMPKCRDIWRSKLRELRRPKMEALDVAYMQADERGDTVEKARIAAEKQKLRDVTADPWIEAAQTPEQLKAVMPDILK